MLENKISLRNPLHFLALGLGTGLVPKAPGTVASFIALLLYLPSIGSSFLLLCLVIVSSFLIGIWVCSQTAEDIGVEDHSGIVWDEFVGMWLTLLLAPPGWAWILIGFCLFRTFDILKPWPINWVDRNVKGGLGIMLDDVLAGIMAVLCMQAIEIFAS